MLEPNQISVKRLAPQMPEGLAGAFGQGGEPFLGRTSIDGIPDHRVTDMGEMHPDLVGASGLQTAFDQARDRPEAPHHTIVRDRRLPLTS